MQMRPMETRKQRDGGDGTQFPTLFLLFSRRPTAEDTSIILPFNFRAAEAEHTDTANEYIIGGGMSAKFLGRDILFSLPMFLYGTICLDDFVFVFLSLIQLLVEVAFSTLLCSVYTVAGGMLTKCAC